MPSFRPTACRRQAQLFLNLRVACDRFLRFACERHPHAGHVHHHRDRAAGERRRAIGQAVAAPVGLHDRLRDRAGGLLKLERHAVGVPQDVHRLAFGQVDVMQRRVQRIDLVLLEPAGRNPCASLATSQNLVRRFGAKAAERVDQELPQRPLVAVPEQLDQHVARNALRDAGSRHTPDPTSI